MGNKSTIANELRELCRVIEQACSNSHSMSIALPIIQNCVEHLSAIALINELNQKQLEFERSLTSDRVVPGS